MFRVARSKLPIMKAILSLCFALLAFVLVSPSHAADTTSPAFKNASVEQFDKLRSNTNNVVLDVRTKKEFESGHIPGAINIDWNGPDFEKQVSSLDRSKTYLVHCAAGVRSSKACNAMAKLKFTNCVNLETGFKAWEKAGKPVAK
jgi:rhodanese-related sulfurtransferase